MKITAPVTAHFLEITMKNNLSMHQRFWYHKPYVNIWYVYWHCLLLAILVILWNKNNIGEFPRYYFPQASKNLVKRPYQLLREFNLTQAQIIGDTETRAPSTTELEIRAMHPLWVMWGNSPRRTPICIIITNNVLWSFVKSRWVNSIYFTKHMKNTFLNFVTFLDTDMAQILEIFPRWRKGLVYPWQAMILTYFFSCNITFSVPKGWAGTFYILYFCQFVGRPCSSEVD